MKISIIDIGTQSLKHYIFEVEQPHKKLLHYKRYSEANLGENDVLQEDAIKRNSNILQECIAVNQKEGVEKLQILGTEILRKAHNARDFTSVVQEISGHDIHIISHDQEALYLYEGFIPLIPDGLNFAAVNIGGGSTEVVVGNKNKMIASKKIPFGVKFLKNTYTINGNMDWDGLDRYLDKEISIDHASESLFVTGVLDFLGTVGPTIGCIPEKNSIPNHPMKMSIDEYISLTHTLRSIPIEELRSYYPKDPHYADNFAIGQSVYGAVARKLQVSTVIPSNNDLTDGVIYNLMM